LGSTVWRTRSWIAKFLPRARDAPRSPNLIHHFRSTMTKGGTSIRATVAALVICLATARPAAGQVITGRVVDAATGTPVARARVTAYGGDGAARRTVTGADGRFSFSLRGSGSYTVEVTRRGYDDTRTDTMSLDPADTVDVVVRMPAAAVRLQPLTVTARRRPLEVVGVFRQATLADSSARGPVRATGRSRSIAVKGIVPTPTACYRLAGAADRVGSIVTLNVEARPSGDYCPELPDAFTYDVRVRGLPPGSYTLRVLHTYRNAVWEPTMAMDTAVTVR
jgi:hypothetical protein